MVICGRGNILKSCLADESTVELKYPICHAMVAHICAICKTVLYKKHKINQCPGQHLHHCFPLSLKNILRFHVTYIYSTDFLILHESICCSTRLSEYPQYVCLH